FFFSSRRRHTRFSRDWSSDVCSSDLSLTLVNSTYDSDIMVLQNGDHIYLDEHVNIRANTSGATESVKFFINDVPFSTQNEPPYRSEERRVGKACRHRSAHDHARHNKE